MIGKILADKYIIDSVIGIGGMAVVYKAHTLRTNRVVAIKVLKEEFRDKADFVRRFEREARAVLSLSHDNIVRLLDVGSEDGIHYIVLEHVVGKTLKEIIEANGALPPKTAASYIGQILDAINHAHEHGIIHGDIKPQNVIIMHGGKVKLMDFGIARKVDASTKTFAGSNVLGSVHYISPEQALGKDITPLSDIYSAGIMLYEMLTGHVPFDGDTFVSIALKHIQEPMPSPKTAGDNVTQAMSDVILKAAQKDPESRYHDAKSMRRDVFRALREPHRRFVKLTPELRSDKWAKFRENKALFWTPVIIILILGLMVGTYFVTLSQTTGTPDKELYAPLLIGKTLKDAEELAGNRGFELIVEEEWVTNDTYAWGVVCSQTPTANTKCSDNQKITVTVSNGDDISTVPELFGMTLLEATAALVDENLKIGDIDYRLSEYPTGTVITYSPEAGTQLFGGDEVDIVISGIDPQTAAMPGVVNLSVTEAVEMLKFHGFTRIFIREVPADEGVNHNTVISQSHEVGGVISLDTMLELTVARIGSSICAADIAFNLEIPSAEANIRVTALQADGTELIIYEEKAASANDKYPLSFVGYTHTNGDYICIVYIDYIEVKRQSFLFKIRRD